MEKDRLKRDLDSNGLSLRELKETLDKLDTDCKVNNSVAKLIYKCAVSVSHWLAYLIFNNNKRWFASECLMAQKITSGIFSLHASQTPVSGLNPVGLHSI